MAEYVGVTPYQTVAVDQNVLLADSIPCPRRNVLHRNGSGILTLRGCGSNCFARYQITYGANIAVPEGGTVGAIASRLTRLETMISTLTMQTEKHNGMIERIYKLETEVDNLYHRYDELTKKVS